MIVGMDIDDTITRHPKFFALISQALVAAGHQVVLITFRADREGTAAELSEWGIAYTELITSTLDEHLETGIDEWKGVVCRRMGVELFFEDTPEVIRHVDPEIVSFLVVNHDRHRLDLLAEADQ